VSVGTLIIRVDASLSIGGGHLSRCLLMAKKMIIEGWDVRFVTVEKQAKSLIERDGYICEKITNEEKIPNHLIKKNKPTVVIADINSKAIFDEDQQYRKHIEIINQQADLLVTFEDMVDYPYPSDIVVIPYCGAEKLKIDSYNNATKYLLGPKYFPLKEEFKNIQTTVSNKVRNVIITMGGSDPEKITLKVLRALNNKRLNANITVVIGSMSEISNQDVRKSTGEIVEKIAIKRDVNNISELISNSDIAFTNSGLTKYEIAARGIPAILISNTEQHAEYSELFAKNGSALHLGFNDVVDYKVIKDAFISISLNYKKRLLMSENGQSLVKSTGVEKIYKTISETLKNRVLI